MSTGTQPTDGGSTQSPMPTRRQPAARKKTKTRRKQNTVTARRFFDLVVLVIGEKTKFTAGQSVPMKDVQDAVLERADLTVKERTQYDDKFLRRRIQFAFRNRRAAHVKGMDPLTVQAAPKQWALTDAGVAKAQELSAAVELPPEPVVELPPEPAVELKTTGDIEAAADEIVEVIEVEAEAAVVVERTTTTRKRKRGPRSISEASGS